MPWARQQAKSASRQQEAMQQETVKRWSPVRQVQQLVAVRMEFPLDQIQKDPSEARRALHRMPVLNPDHHGYQPQLSPDGEQNQAQC